MEAEQHCTLGEHMYIYLYSTVQLPGASMDSVEVAVVLLGKLWKDK